MTILEIRLTIDVKKLTTEEREQFRNLVSKLGTEVKISGEEDQEQDVVEQLLEEQDRMFQKLVQPSGVLKTKPKARRRRLKSKGE